MKILPKLFTLSFFICLIAIEYLATTTITIKPLENSWDKANHFIAFFVLYINLYFSHFNIKPKYIICLLIAFAVQIEIVQAFIPNRYFSLLDIVADSIGILIGIILVKLINKKLVKN
jgi:VanZ family protein